MIPNRRIVELALDVGFDACGVSLARKLEGEEMHFSSWIQNGYQAEMGYMVRNRDLRMDTTLLVPNSKSVISILYSYNRSDLPVFTETPKISRYALGPDYHNVVKKNLYELLTRIRLEFGDVNGRAFVDSAPVLERAWATSSGLGWVGKNSNLINSSLGSFVFIAELIVDADIEPTTLAVADRCGNCTRCIDACPTGAIVSPRVIDSGKCISYTNIEKKTPLSAREYSSLHGWCFGCDICQEVCPWNKKARIIDHSRLQSKHLNGITPDELSGLTKEQFDELFGNTPLTRAGYDKITSAIRMMLTE